MADRRKWKNIWVHKRSNCRKAVPISAYLFFLILMSAPFIVFGDDKAQPNSASLFGLNPDLVKLAFLLLFSLAVWLLKRAIDENTKNQNMLYTNQRELARILTQLTTAHNINHNQGIEAPKLIGGEGQ